MKLNITKKIIFIMTLLALAIGLVACSVEKSDDNKEYQSKTFIEQEGLMVLDEEKETEEVEESKISVGYGSDELINTYYEDVVSALKKSGFSNIETSFEIIPPDLSTDGMCSKITINGAEEFEAYDKFNSEDMVVVYYGVGQRAKVPAGWTELLERHYEEVEKLFIEAGFTNVILRGHEIDYNENKVFEGSVVNISIGGNAVYEANTEFLANIEVCIDYGVKPVVTPETTPEPALESKPEPQPEPEKSTINAETPSGNTETKVWIPQSGSKYHRSSGCSNMKNPTQVTLNEAQSLGYTACKRCYK